MFIFIDAIQSLEILIPRVEQPQMEWAKAELILGGQDRRIKVSHQLSQDLQKSLHQAGQKQELLQDVHPYVGTLEQEGSLGCPESIEDSREDVDGLILYQTVEEETLETETLMRNGSGHFDQDIPGKDGPVCLLDQIGVISKGHMDYDSFINVPVVRPCYEVAGEATKQLGAKPNEIEVESLYSEYAQQSCLATSDLSHSVASKSDESITKNSTAEVSMDQENCDGTVEDLTSDSSKFKNRTLQFSVDQENKDNLLQQNETKMNPTLPANRIDTKSSDLNFFLLPDSDIRRKPQELPVQEEETETETAEDAYPDSSNVNHGLFLSSSVKTENVVTKAKQLDSLIKPKTQEIQPELLSLSMKLKNLEAKPDVLHCSADSDGAKIKPEAKPETLRFATYPDEVNPKSETEPEDLGFKTNSDNSERKFVAMPEHLGVRFLPDIIAKKRQEQLEADSTFLTPKVEQADGLLNNTEILLLKGQVKEEKPSTPG